MRASEPSPRGGGRARRDADADTGLRAQASVPPALHSDALLGGARVRIIEHAGEHYFLRLTRNGKLILSK